MKDWRKSPEPASMMGLGGSSEVGIWPSRNEGRTAGIPPLPPFGSPGRPLRSKINVSLADMARRVIIQRIHLFDNLGDAPFNLVRPILESCTVLKLWELEEGSPALIAETDYLWQRYCLRDFRDIREACQTGHMDAARFESWRELYRAKMVRDHEVKEAARARLTEKYAALRADKEAHKVRIVTETPAMQRRRAAAAAARFGMGSGGRGAASNVSQGQRMLSKARRAAVQQSKAVQAPRGGQLTRQVHDASRGRSTTGTVTVAEEGKMSTHDRTSSEQTSTSYPGRTDGPPGFMRRATLAHAERLEMNAMRQLSRAMYADDEQIIVPSSPPVSSVKRVAGSDDTLSMDHSRSQVVPRSPTSRKRPQTGVRIEVRRRP